MVAAADRNLTTQGRKRSPGCVTPRSVFCFYRGTVEGAAPVSDLPLAVTQPWRASPARWRAWAPGGCRLRPGTLIGAWPWLAPTLVAALLLLPHLTAAPLWADEADTVSAVTRPLPDLLRLLGHQDSPLGAYYLGLHLWGTLAGTSALAVRLPSAVALLLAVACLAHIAQRRYGRHLGCAAGLLLATNSFVLEFGADARPYAFAILAGVVAFGILWGDLQPTPRRRWGYGLAVVLGICAHLFFLLLVPAHLAGLALSGRPVRPWWRPAALAVLVTSPLIVLASTQSAEVGYLTAPSLRTVGGCFQALSGGSGWTSVPVLLVLIWGASRRLLGRQAGLLMWLALPAAVLLSVSVVHPLYLNRYVAESAPALSLLLVGMLSVAATRTSATVLAVLLVAGTAQTVVHQQAPYRYEDLRSASDGILDRATPGDGVVFLPSGVRTAMNYYLQRLDPASVHPGDVLLDATQSEAQVGNFGGHTVLPSQIPPRLLQLKVVWLVSYRDQPAGKGALSATVHAVLSRCFVQDSVGDYGLVEVRRETATGACPRRQPLSAPTRIVAGGQRRHG